MLDRKGFTLVEILAVIVIIAIISVAAVPAVLSISTRNKENMYCKKVQTIERSAQLYASDVFEDIDEGEMVDDNEACKLYVDNKPMEEKEHCQLTDVITLAEQGYVNYEQGGKSKIKNEVLDPRNSSSMLASKIMVFTVNKRVHAQFVYSSIRDALKCSDYIQANSVQLRELYFMENDKKLRKVNCESNNLDTCKAKYH